MSLVIDGVLADQLHALALNHFRALERQDAALASDVLREDYVNEMATDEPPACRRPGVPGFMATAAWLHLAFRDLAFAVEHVISDAEQTVARVRMTGTQTGPFVIFPGDERPTTFPPTHRAFDVRQIHVFRHDGRRHTGHLAVREDLPMMTQLGHLPPSGAAILRFARAAATGTGRRSARTAIAVSARAADEAR